MDTSNFFPTRPPCTSFKRRRFSKGQQVTYCWWTTWPFLTIHQVWVEELVWWGKFGGGMSHSFTYSFTARGPRKLLGATQVYEARREEGARRGACIVYRLCSTYCSPPWIPGRLCSLQSTLEQPMSGVCLEPADAAVWSYWANKSCNALVVCIPW